MLDHRIKSTIRDSDYYLTLRLNGVNRFRLRSRPKILTICPFQFQPDLLRATLHSMPHLLDLRHSPTS